MDPSEESDLIPEIQFDYELVFSRNSPIGTFLPGDLNKSIPVYYNTFKNRFYASLNNADTDYYVEIKNAPKELLMKGQYGQEVLEYPETGSMYHLDHPVYRLLEIPGVVADQFVLKLGRREIWRFQFFKENLEEVSSLLINRFEEVTDKSQDDPRIEYLGKPTKLSEYLDKYHYRRKVIFLRFTEEITEKYFEIAPQYAHPFVFKFKSPDMGEGFSRVIRSSTGKIEPRGMLGNQAYIRVGNTIITEDTRVGGTEIGFLDFKKNYLPPFCAGYSWYDGNESHTAVLMDDEMVQWFLLKMGEANKSGALPIKFILDKVQTYYEPMQQE